LATTIRKIGGLGFKSLTAESGKVRTNRDKLQNPNWDRFDEIGYNYRMNQMGAAVALAQMERAEYFIDLRRAMGVAYTEALSNSDLLTPQQVIDGYYHTYYTFSAKFNGEKLGVSWEVFRKKYIELGGDGIYAASKLQHQEPVFRDRKIGHGETPVAVDLQQNLMNFTTNQANEEERNIQIDVMSRTQKYFGDTLS
jgi:perosamine synthetase